MENMLNYIFYLLNETDVDPTLENKGPLLAGPTYGLYHPNYGIFGNTPSRELITEWINKHIGYDEDSVGSLNWMTSEYYDWSQEYNTPESILTEFETWYSNNKTDIKGQFIVLASYYSGGSFIDEMIHEYERQGRAAVNLFQSATKPSISSLLVLMTNGKDDGTKPFTRGVVAVNSLYSWSLDYTNMANGGAIEDFKAMNIEIIRALNSISETGYESEFGPQAEWTYSVTIPQFEGVFGSIPVSYIDKEGKEIPILEGIAKIVELTNGWAKLKEKNNTDKKVAIILYNYPPGKAELGASYLEVFQSLSDLLKEMYDNGYDIGMEKSEIPNATELYTLVAAFGNKGTWAQGL
jgi:cobaltochelatase CobN